jgi:hypothetical protein
MDSLSLNSSAILAISFFLLPIIYKSWKKESLNMSDLVKCSLSAMGLPNLIICLFYLIIDPTKALEMPETIQHLTIAVLIIIYLVVLEIVQIFKQKDTS